MTGPTIVSLLVSFAALAISTASLWKTVLKPADIQLDLLHSRVNSGGMHGVPALYGANLVFALVNLGAKTGLLHKVEVVTASASGAAEFATGVQGPDQIAPRISVAGTPTTFPITVEAGAVQTLSIDLEIQGPFLTEASTKRLGPDPSREPLARMLPQLKCVEIGIVLSYQARAGILRNKSVPKAKPLKVEIPGQLFRDQAADFWEKSKKPELAELARGGQSAT